MDYREAREYMEEAAKYGVVPGLGGVRELLKRLGNPQRDLRFIHIAGTNGKGSVLAFLSSILKCAGLSVGRYISPAVFHYRERIQTDEKPIKKESFAENMTAVRECADRMEEEGLPHPTAFEMETAVAFLYFLQCRCDIVVMEAGMGGLLDATNVVENTLAAVITPIGLDHTDYLGKTLPEIARQKAGIIKEGCSVVTASQQEEVMEVIGRKAGLLQCPLFAADAEELENLRSELGRQRFDWGPYRDLEIVLDGRFQPENALLALKTVKALESFGIFAGEQEIRKGLLCARWMGRFTVIADKPLFVIDGAHNADAARRLADSVRFYFTNRKIIYIMGVLKDKDYESVLDETAPLADHIVTVTPPGGRALPAYELARAAAGRCAKVTAADSPEEAVELSYLLADRDAVILAFGSLSYLGRVTDIVKNRDKMRSDLHGRQRED